MSRSKVKCIVPGCEKMLRVYNERLSPPTRCREHYVEELSRCKVCRVVNAKNRYKGICLACRQEMADTTKHPKHESFDQNYWLRKPIMNRDQLKAMAEKRARMHNKGDLKVYRQPTVNDAKKKRVSSEDIDQQVADFLAGGGEIKQVPSGTSSYNDKPMCLRTRARNDRDRALSSDKPASH